MNYLKSKKERDFVKWYHELIKATELVDLSVVQGCVVYSDYCLQLWQQIKNFLDSKLRNLGFKEYYFPTLIPIKSFKKQKKHFDDFFREVLIVSKVGQNNLEEGYAIRPTSEAVIYESFAKWIKEEKDLPLRVNQYCSVMRWESFKPNMPLLRSNEFLWQESHSAHSTEKEADKYVKELLKIYIDLHENYLAMPVVTGFKPKHRMFPGAKYTMALEALMPDLRSVQSATSHSLGQNFSKSFNIKFNTKTEKNEFAWQTCHGITTRVIGALIMLHSDNNGLVIPPEISPYQVIFINAFDKNLLKNVNIRFFIDKTKKTQDETIKYWILMGAPIIVFKNGNKYTLIRRDTLEKFSVNKKSLIKSIKKTLTLIQYGLYKKAKEFKQKYTTKVCSWKEFEEIALNKGGFIEAYWCNNPDCSIGIRKLRKYSARVINPSKPLKCIHCNSKAEYKAVFAPAY